MRADMFINTQNIWSIYAKIIFINILEWPQPKGGPIVEFWTTYAVYCTTHLRLYKGYSVETVELAFPVLVVSSISLYVAEDGGSFPSKFQ